MKFFITALVLLGTLSAFASPCTEFVANDADNREFLEMTEDKPYFSSVEFISRVTKEEEGPWRDQEITKTEMMSIYFYTSYMYQTINPSLRKNPTIDDAIEKQLCSALNHLPSLQTTVYRRVKLSKEVLKKFSLGKIVTEDAFVSTTKSKQLLKGFKGNVFFKIKTISGKDISGFSRYQYEQEVLIPAGARFKVIENRTSLISGNKNITMEEID